MLPFFTDCACTADLDGLSRQIQNSKSAMGSALSAQQYWYSQVVPVQVISAAHCRVSRPRFVDRYAPRDLPYAVVPVKSQVWHYDRDSMVGMQYPYDGRGYRRQFQVAVNSYKVLSIPWSELNGTWASRRICSIQQITQSNSARCSVAQASNPGQWHRPCWAPPRTP